MFSCCLFYSSVFLYFFIVYLYFYFCAASYGVIKNDDYTTNKKSKPGKYPPGQLTRLIGRWVVLKYVGETPTGSLPVTHGAGEGIGLLCVMYYDRQVSSPDRRPDAPHDVETSSDQRCKKLGF